MKKSTLMIALGGKPPTEDEDVEVSDDEATDEDMDADTDEAIKTFLDPEADMETRVAAFRTAVKGCY